MSDRIQKPFNLLRWFSVASLLALLPVGGLTGMVLSHLVTDETLERDASLTAEFIYNCILVQKLEVGFGEKVDFVPLLDRRIDPATRGIAPDKAQMVRKAIFEHFTYLPDTLLVNLFARDGRIIWSTNKAIVGTVVKDEDLEETFRERKQVAHHHSDAKAERGEQAFDIAPKQFFIENYIPLFDTHGEVVLVAEVYKEPKRLMASIERGRYLIWSSTAVAGLIVYLALFSIIRRGSSQLQAQQKQLVEMDSYAYMGELSTAIAHSLRNPLMNIRSSAELTLEVESDFVRKNVQNIINQVDLLSKWVRKLLLVTRPASGETGAVAVAAVLDEVLEGFDSAFAKAGVRVVWERDATGGPMVAGDAALLTQVFNSIVANAVEAMPQGGELRIALAVEAARRRCRLTVADSGAGMSEEQLTNAFKPFQTTKVQGLGFGLAMVKRVLDRFDGTVALSSRENAGTAVHLEFKLA